MIIRNSEDIYTLVKSFEERTIHKSDWTHAAHLIVGLYYCKAMPFAVAKNLMRDGICWLNDSLGIPNTESSGYHETLTVFWMKRIWNFLDESTEGETLTTLAQQLIERYVDPDLPLTYYSRELLFSAAARRDYFPPDLRFSRPLYRTISFCVLKPLL